MINVRPLSVAEQLARLREWREILESRKESDDRFCDLNFGRADMLEECWEAIEKNTDVQGDGTFISRGSTEGDRPPLAELFSYVANGFYPPPELLLTLTDAWLSYQKAGGSITLEEAFFGKPKPKAGNYSSRALKAVVKTYLGRRLGAYMRSGVTKAKAAELLADEFAMSEESIKRTIKTDPRFSSEPLSLFLGESPSSEE